MKTVTATVESIDLATRAVTLKGPDGKVMGLKVGEEVAITYTEAMAVSVEKP